jgi:predicted dehydrogenase
MSNLNQKNVAVVGCGYWGKNLVRNFAELGALRMVCDTSYELLEKFKHQYDVVGVNDIETILDMPEVKAVVIATPASTHAGLIRQALKAGKDVFVEKPLALTLDDALAIRNLLAQTDRLLMVGHLLEYHPALVKLRQLVAEGTIGQLRYLYSNRLSFGKVRTEENVLWSFAPHDICAILRFVGQLPTSVQAVGSTFLGSVEDVCTVNLQFEQNINAHIFVSWLHPFKEQRLVVVGDRGTAVFDDVSADEKLTLYQQAIELNPFPVLKQNVKTVISISTAEPLKSECQHFLDCVASRQPPITDVQNGIDVLTVLQAAQLSIESKGKAMVLKEHHGASR